MEALDRLGLTGSYQVHVAPNVLSVDERAHQVFVGFGNELSALLARFVNRYDPGVQVVRVASDSHTRLPLREAVCVNWASGEAAVIPATRADHAGGLYGLVQIVDRLLGPGGCPWDQEQTHESLRRHLIEEAYELVDAIDAGDDERMREELGDVLLQPLMHAQMEAFAGRWDIDVVAKAITEKLVRRHPHVFADGAVADSEEVLRNWDTIKRQEKSRDRDATVSILDGVPRSLPALLRAYEVSKRAARAGFEWPDIEGVWGKLREEERELQEAMATGAGVPEELGDLLFTVVNLARWKDVDPENALRSMVDRFSQRFKRMESASTLPLSELSAEAWDELWNEAKQS